MTEFTGEVHPFADRFPMLTDEELSDLADDIRDNGQLHPILLSPEGVLLDGRNRLKACDLAGVPPKFETYEGNPVALIVSANIKRRQMTPGQAAIAAAIGLWEDGKRITDKNGNRRWHLAGLDDAIQMASREALRRCGVILDYDTERGTNHADDVFTGSRPLADVYKGVMVARRTEQEAAAAAERAAQELEERSAAERAAFDELRAGAPDLAELVRADKLTLDDARAAWDNRRREEIAAQQAAAGAWGQAADGLRQALSWAKSGYTPPDPMPSGYTTATEFIEWAESLIATTKEWN